MALHGQLCDVVMGSLVASVLWTLLLASGPLAPGSDDVAEWAALFVVLDAHEQDPDDPEVLLALMLAHARQGELAGAMRLSDLLSHHAAYRARALLYRAAIHELIGERAEAERARELALDQLDVVLTDRATALQFLETARQLLREGRSAPIHRGDDDAPPDLERMRSALRPDRGDE